MGLRVIAGQIDRSAGMVSRELRRNGSAPDGLGHYFPYAAQKRAELCGRRPKVSKFDKMEGVFRGRQEMQVSPETIY